MENLTVGQTITAPDGMATMALSYSRTHGTNDVSGKSLDIKSINDELFGCTIDGEYNDDGTDKLYWFSKDLENNGDDEIGHIKALEMLMDMFQCSPQEEIHFDDNVSRGSEYVASEGTKTMAEAYIREFGTNDVSGKILKVIDIDDGLIGCSIDRSTNKDGDKGLFWFQCDLFPRFELIK